jgi:hypothetical protein
MKGGINEWVGRIAAFFIVVGMFAGGFIFGLSAGRSTEQSRWESEIERIRAESIALVAAADAREHDATRRLDELTGRVGSLRADMGSVLSGASSLGDRIRRITVLLGELDRIVGGGEESEGKNGP